MIEMLSSDVQCSIANEYTHSTAEALDALFTKGATITSQYYEDDEYPNRHVYYLDKLDHVIDVDDEYPHVFTKASYMGKWKIEYPKKAER